MMGAGESLKATFERCSERMRRVWAEESEIPKEPEYEFRVSFVSTESVGRHLMQLIAASPTKNRRYNYSKVGGGNAGCPGSRT